MLSLENISKSFNLGTVNEHQIFDQFNLEVETGEFVSIIGSNGSGKTTLLNLICGSIQPEEGRIVVNEEDITDQEEHVRYARIGRVFQDPTAGTSPNLTLLENLSMADNKGKPWDLTSGVNKDRVDYYQELLRPIGLGLENKLDDVVSSFSGGQRQATALLMATMRPIDCLILDEHTAALDPKTADVIMEMTDKIVKEKKIMALMVTHNLKYSVQYGNRLLMMHEGQAILDKSGPEKAHMDVDELLGKFYEISIERGNSI